jgi:hypothetical protein
MKGKTCKILWAVKKGDEDWKEAVITEDYAKHPEAKEWAEREGYDRFRTSTWTEDNRPDFVAALNI